MAEAAEAAAFSAGIDTARYPIYDLQAAHGLIQAAQESLRERGLASLPGFLRDDALRAMADDARRAAPRAFATDASHNAYQLQADARFPPTHVRNVRMRTRVASTAFDELPAERGLARLYALDCLTRFVGAVTGRPTHRLADPLGCCSVNVFHPGDFHAWHFDEAATSVTLCLQAAERGGDFEHSAPLREGSAELAADRVAAIVNATTDYRADLPAQPTATPALHTASFAPGTLQIIRGRSCLHRVTAVGRSVDRLVAVLCYAEEAGRPTRPRCRPCSGGGPRPSHRRFSRADEWNNGAAVDDIHYVMSAGLVVEHNAR